MLKEPGSNQPFNPTLNYFLGVFDTYDLEETLGIELNKYDPNNSEDMQKLARKSINSLKWITNESYHYSWVLVNLLEKALNNPSYDFSYIFKNDEDNCFFLPWEWNIKDPRGFFEEILKVAKEEWKEDLEKASKEDPSTW